MEIDRKEKILQSLIDRRDCLEVRIGSLREDIVHLKQKQEIDNLIRETRLKQRRKLKSTRHERELWNQLISEEKRLKKQLISEHSEQQKVNRLNQLESKRIREESARIPWELINSEIERQQQTSIFLERTRATHTITAEPAVKGFHMRIAEQIEANIDLEKKITELKNGCHKPETFGELELHRAATPSYTEVVNNNNESLVYLNL